MAISGAGKKIICGIQQIGIGVPHLHEAWKWYRQVFGMDIRMFEESAEAPLMTPYTGGKVRSRSAALAINMKGGGGFEIWQYTSRDPQPADFEIQIGDLGIFAGKIKAPDVQRAYKTHLSNSLNLLGEPMQDPGGKEHYFIKDPYGNIFQVVGSDKWFMKTKFPTGGAEGAMIGVSDIEKARLLYSKILGYDRVVYDESGRFNDLSALPSGNKAFRRILLRRSEPVAGSFSGFLGPGSIELFQALEHAPGKIFENRYWGDLGFIHLCFDIKGMSALERECASIGFPFTVDSSDVFEMGEASGHFSYVEDPDGTLIEFVETHKIPLIKKIGWYLPVGRRSPEKKLPRWLLKLLSFNRVKD